jgi:predicted nucleic acid-binding protein
VQAETIDDKIIHTFGVDYKTAAKSAEIRTKHRIPMADSVIAAAAQIYECSVFSDDNHFKEIENLKTKWC